MLEFEYDKDFFNHLRRLIGQLQGIEKMAGKHRCPDDVKIQFSAAEQSLYNLFHKKFFEALQKNDASLLSQLLEKYSDKPYILETLEIIRKNFPYFTLIQLIFYFNLLNEFDKNGYEIKPE
jgi:DNA-binding FrmR family transcriptional regulator